MNTFTASNGMTVERDHNDDVLINRGTESTSLFMADGTALALREFFRAEEDERLGRSRYGGYVVYPAKDDPADRVVVVEESTGYNWFVRRRQRVDYGEQGVLEAARQHFDAHPEPKPEWHEALVIAWKEGPKALLPHVALRDPRDNGDGNLGWHVELNYAGASWHSLDQLIAAIGDAEVTILVPKPEVAS